MAAGRPREFDMNFALDQALKVFWTNGYEGASLPELTSAMGINKPSLYAAFGNKEALFRKVLDRYLDGPACHVSQALKEPTAKAVVLRLLRDEIAMVSDNANPNGCFIVQGALACSESARAAHEELKRCRKEGETALRLRFESALAEGDLPAKAQPADLARFIMILQYGIAVQSAGGATREELLKVVDLAMASWPESGSPSDSKSN